MEKVHIGIIGGSGLYDMAEVTDRRDVTLTTPFGDPSVRTSWAHCVASVSPFWPVTAPATVSHRPS
jgi:purine nucleoside phosphorylase